MAFEHLNLFGNVIDIVAPASGKIKYVKLAQSTFSSDRSKKSPFYNVVVFEKDFDKIADVEAALAEVRAQKGNDKAALKNVALTARLSMDKNDALQTVLVSVGAKEPVATVAQEAPAEAEAEAVVAADDLPF